MRTRMLPSVVVCVLGLVSLAGAQQQGNSTRKVADGGTSGRMESIFIPPKAGAPFTLMLATEWSRVMANGGSFTLANERRIVRDSKGRIYQERWILVPKGSKVKSFMDIFQITDPEKHTWYNCRTADKVCELLLYGLETTDSFVPATAPSGPLPDGNGVRRHDDLGASNTAGVDTHGYRETVTLNEGVMGNDRPMVTTREFWYSAKLGFNLLSMVDDPQSGKQVFTVKDLSLSEPELSLFEVPEGYTVVDHRSEKE
jgi:hypothetical protein